MDEIEYVLGATLILHRSGVNPILNEERRSGSKPRDVIKALYAKAHADLLKRIAIGLPANGHLTGEIEACRTKAKWTCVVGAEEHYAPPYEAATFSIARMGLYLVRE